MPMGPGRYDEACTFVRLLSNADGVVLIVLGGDRGSGFSMQMRRSAYGQQPSDAVHGHALVATLRAVADQIEADLKSNQQGKDT